MLKSSSHTSKTSLSTRKKSTILRLALPILLAWVWAGYIEIMQQVTYNGYAEGEVMELVKSRNGRIAPIIRYVASNGKSYYYESKTFESGNTYMEGQKLTIRYHPDHPEDARIPGFMQNHAGVLVFTIIWGFLSVVYFLIVFYSGQRTQIGN